MGRDDEHLEVVVGFQLHGIKYSSLLLVDLYSKKDSGREILGITDSTYGGQDRLGSVLNRQYSDHGDSVRVSEKYDVLTDVNGDGTSSHTTFTVDKSTGAIAMFEGSPLEKSNFVYA